MVFFSGDASAVKRFWLGGQDMAGEDYDQRTALHLGKFLHPVTSGFHQAYFRLTQFF